MDSSSRPKPPKTQHDEGVLYSDVTQSQAGAESPPGQTNYADLDHAGSRGSTKAAPKDHAIVM